MTTAPRSVPDLMIEAVAAVALGAAAGFALAQRVPVAVGVAAGVVIALVAALVLRRFDAAAPAFGEAFAPVAFPDEEEEAILLLDDPLPVVDAQSRVVRLFAAQPASDEAAPIAGPGEMVARIEDFLGMTRGAPAPERGPREAAARDDAHAALHAALADIRRSLRHG